METILFERKPTYFVSYTATLAIASLFTIPNRHRREGDSYDNPQVRVIIQNDLQDVSIAVYAHPAIQVLDVSNTVCAQIYVPTAWQLETPETLKIKTGPDSFASGLTGATYRIIVFYAKP